MTRTNRSHTDKKTPRTRLPKVKLEGDDWSMLNCIATTKHAMAPGYIPDSGYFRPLRGLQQLDMSCIFCGTTDRQYFGLTTETPISHNYERNVRYRELRAQLTSREARAILAKRQKALAAEQKIAQAEPRGELRDIPEEDNA